MERSIRILFLAPDVNLSEHDGQSVHVLSLATEFGNLGHRVLLLVAKADQDLLAPGMIEVRVIPNRGWKSYRIVGDIARGFRPDIVYERRFSPKLGAFVKLLTGSPYLLEVNGIPWIDSEDSQPLPRSSNIVFGTMLYKAPLRIIVPSSGLATLLADRFRIHRSRIVVVPNGVDLNLFHPLEQSDARQSMGLALDDRIVVFAGKLAPWQGLSTLLEAASLISGVPRLRVLIVGQGPLAKIMSDQIRNLRLENTVRLIGPISHRRMPEVLAAADVCVAPFSRTRNDQIQIAPLKLFEYMAAARAVVASDVAGVREILGGTGILVPPDSPVELAAALQGLLSDPGKSKRIGEQARLLVQRDSWTSRAELTMEVIASCLDSPL